MSRTFVNSYLGQPKFFFHNNLLRVFKPRPFLENSTRKIKFLKKMKKHRTKILKRFSNYRIYKKKKKFFFKKITNNNLKKKKEICIINNNLLFLSKKYFFFLELKIKELIVPEKKIKYFFGKFSECFPMEKKATTWVGFWGNISIYFIINDHLLKKKIKRFLKIFFF